MSDQDKGLVEKGAVKEVVTTCRKDGRWDLFEERINALSPVGQEPKKNTLKSFVEKCSTEAHRHLEMFAAAYLKATNIPPERAVLVEQRTENGVQWFFKRSDKPDYEAMIEDILLAIERREMGAQFDHDERTGWAMIGLRTEIGRIKAEHTPQDKPETGEEKKR